MVKIISFIIITLICFSCQWFEFSLENYHSPRLSVDTSIKSRKLKIISTIKLQESNELVVGGINAATINDSATKLLICDPSNRSIDMFDLNTGKLLNYIVAERTLADSFALMGFTNDYTKSSAFGFREFKYIKSSEYDNYGIPDNYGLQKNTYFIPLFISDNIHILTQVFCPAISPDNYKILDNRVADVICNMDLKMKKFNMIQNNIHLWATQDVMYYSNKLNGILISANDYSRIVLNQKYDSLAVLGLYNKDGKMISKIFDLTENYLASKYYYNLKYTPNIVELDKELYITLPYDLTVYGMNNKKLFSLRNLPFSNDTGFYYLKIYYQTFNNPKLSTNERFSLIRKFLPERIINNYSINKNLIFLIIIFDEKVPGGYYYILQEYSTSGNLQSQTNIYSDLKNEIKYLLFDKINNNLLIFKKNQEGWSIEKREWE